ncbi:type II toxin-antitoxin system RelE/ParE family toxin [Marinivivus vitaminiproducens]|nr:type II toxin-antitoxin system RelE/ParE family toxin [Geminicoccaceae bacterium SCSIO 64248]
MRFAPAARRDLRDIWTYSARQWGTMQAERYVRQIEAACRSVARDDQAGSAISEVRPGYRKLRVGSHNLFFRHGEGAVVDVIRILHVRMDVDRHL